MLDTQFRVETPEGMALAIRPAGLMPRALAYLVDLTVRGLLMIALIALLGSLGRLGTGLALLCYFLLEWFYPVLFECLPGGATPGKRMLGLKVVMDNGLPVSTRASVLRNLLRVVDFMPVGYAAACVACLMRSDFKRLGDILAQTVVVYRREPARFAGLPSQEARPPEQALSAAQQAAVLALAARAPRLTPARLDELAELAEAVLPKARSRSESTGQRLMALAQWLVKPQSPH